MQVKRILDRTPVPALLIDSDLGRIAKVRTVSPLSCTRSLSRPPPCPACVTSNASQSCAVRAAPIAH